MDENKDTTPGGPDQPQQPEESQPQQPPQSEPAAPQPEAGPAEAAGPTPPPEPTAELTKDAKMWAMLCHLAALAGYIGIPFGNILGPLIVWLIKKDEFTFVDDQGKEALNFQISMTIYAIVSSVLICIGVGIFLLIAVGIVNLIFIIIAAIKANAGVAYRYPLCIRLVK